MGIIPYFSTELGQKEGALEALGRCCYENDLSDAFDD